MGYENAYSFLDRLLHRMAFVSSPAQAALSDIEDRLFAEALAAIRIDRPVFVTALPRAGTTLLLELLVGTGELASHCYRDMPFVMCPLLWQRFASRFHTSSVPRERAHGDGMLVGVDSPEALEETIWRWFWREHYRPGHITPWQDESDPEFTRFLHSHVKKVILLRSASRSPARRYISKNNLNIARLDALRRCFPDAIVVIPFRHPLQHAASLRRQHLNFLEIHRTDRFAKDYMAAIGHYDFGVNLRPINFAGWLESAHSSDAADLSFWVEYWTAVYAYLLRTAEGSARFLCYDILRDSPTTVLAGVADLIGLGAPEQLLAQAPRIRRMREHSVDTEDVDSEVLGAALDVYDSLRAMSSA